MTPKVISVIASGRFWISVITDSVIYNRFFFHSGMLVLIMYTISDTFISSSLLIQFFVIIGWFGVPVSHILFITSFFHVLDAAVTNLYHFLVST